MADRLRRSGAASPHAPGYLTPRSRLAVLVAVLAVITALVGALAGFGSRWGLWHFGTGFSMLRWAVYASIAVGLLSLIALWRTRPGAGRRGMGLAIFALVVSAALFVVPWQYRANAEGAPPIHDITTDTENPPEFSAIVPLRADAPNETEYGGPEIAEQQREAYPDIGPVTLDEPADQAFQRALEAADDMGWELVESDPEAGRIEATATTFWFGFKDDVVIRLTPANGGTTVDVRSVSRIGRGDMGTNARRVREYLEELED